ncbi:NAD(P)-dependent dehydrogenase (short-subunit alcohol dehydrogenase family)/pimeloyl-ACP methyl ester carboxylesterase [Amycolatopsis umgeniensis]|uniref:NAD(P)-dependent dehydrogenase (Short-subunit alcohol dehydrogenase family)/pimeloyl-ACP methyl ester carboxylesterase n=1 Tax=Amycolatopsis umgeniensis TaxID=336628 RepID=A0A841B368_9PSEU|nr:SDR family oxidoreductase [Amycolatopsis umgeniensis]MBB5853175.1 NAD(P)-dependent dehydrogenase (short-subunit alcohol dehydrogenase family)/pimeloyl-ACP methyl ester carboxylesterase [Amycolatopsis umgeniensis]
MSHKWVTASDGVRLLVRVTGVDDAPTVVLVHGYPDNGSMWDGVAALLEQRFRVVVYDVRGAGRSDKPSGRASYKLDQLSEDLAAVVDEVQPVGKVHLLAHDWGSIQTWHSVTGDRLRGRLASFTSISGPSLDHAGAWFRAQARPNPKRIKNALVQWAHSTYILGFQLPLVPQLLWRTGAMGALIGRMDPAAAAPSTSDGLHGLNLYRANVFTRLSRPKPRNAEIPVQVLAPTGDKFVTTPLQTEIERWAPDLRVRRIVGTHWVVREKPHVIAKAAAELIDHVEGGEESRALKQARQGGFAHKLVLITGAGSGIGRATALAFADKGADLVITDINGSAAADTAKLLRDKGATVGEYTVDSSDAEAVEKFAQQVKEEFGVPDIVVNNAGIGLSGPFLDTTVKDWERLIDVNLWGVIHGCRVFAEQMRERAEGGQIVNVASAAAYLPSKILSAYATTKSAVLTLSICLRAELAAENIGVTAICPGIVNTNITSTTRFVGVDDVEQKRRQKSSSKLYAKRGFGPERVARDILRAVEKDKAIQPSTPEAKAALVLSRLTPGLLRAAAKLDVTP